MLCPRTSIPSCAHRSVGASRPRPGLIPVSLNSNGRLSVFWATGFKPLAHAVKRRSASAAAGPPASPPRNISGGAAPEVNALVQRPRPAAFTPAPPSPVATAGPAPSLPCAKNRSSHSWRKCAGCFLVADDLDRLFEPALQITSISRAIRASSSSEAASSRQLSWRANKRRRTQPPSSGRLRPGAA